MGKWLADLGEEAPGCGDEAPRTRKNSAMNSAVSSEMGAACASPRDLPEYCPLPPAPPRAGRATKAGRASALRRLIREEQGGAMHLSPTMEQDLGDSRKQMLLLASAKIGRAHV